MSEITVHLPESLRRSIQTLAEKEGYSVDQFLATVDLLIAITRSPVCSTAS